MARRITMREAAEYIGVKPTTWAQYYRTWGVPHYKVGKTVLFETADLDAFLASKRVA